MLSKVSEIEQAFGLVLQDKYLFALLFWADDLSLPCTPEQKMLLTDDSERQLWVTGRKLGKTMSLERDVLWHIVMRFLSTSTNLYECIFVTPRESHLVPTRDRIFSKINNTPFFRSLVSEKNKAGGGSGTLEAINGLKWHFRIEGDNGDENMSGVRAHIVLKDEGAFGNFICHNSLLMTAYPDAKWKITGVPNGVRDSPFYKLDTDEKMNKGWSKHNYPSFINPLYQTEEAQERLVQDFGGKSTQGYLNHVLGQWGEEAYTSFPPGSIAIDHTLHPIVREFREREIQDNLDNLSRLVVLPPLEGKYAVGLDYGFSPDPSVFTVFHSKEKFTWTDSLTPKSVWREIARFTLFRVKLPVQTRFAYWLLTSLNVIKFATDHIEILQALGEYPNIGEKLVNADPGGSTAMLGADGKPMLGSDGREIRVRNKQYYTDELKVVFQTTLLNQKYHTHLWLGADTPLIDAVSGLTERKTQAGYTVYEAHSPDEEHPKDSLLYALAAILSAREQELVDEFEAYLGLVGWVGRASTPVTG